MKYWGSLFSALLLLNSSSNLYAADLSARSLYFKIKSHIIEQKTCDYMKEHVRGSLNDRYCFPVEVLGDAANESYEAFVADLAFQIVRWKFTLENSGYPPSTWRSDLIRYEDYQLERLERGLNTLTINSSEISIENAVFATYPALLIGNIVRATEKYNEKNGKKLIRIGLNCECGGGFLSITTKVQPANGRVTLITDFGLSICQHMKDAKPDSFENCGTAYSIVEGGIRYVAGSYLYQASWPNGIKIPPTKIRFREEEFEGATITFTPNGIKISYKELTDTSDP